MSALPQIGYSGNPQFMFRMTIGSSGKKRKQSATVKEEKKQTTGDIKCISCDLKGHSTSRSIEWKNCQGLTALKESSDVMFRNMVRSDGFTVDFLFSRKKKTKEDMTIHNHTLPLEDFSYNEVQDNYRPAFLDPGRRSVFTAAIGLDHNKHQVRSCFTKEYYHMTGSTRYAAKLEKKKAGALQMIESGIPTAKTSNIEQYDRHVQYILKHFEALFFFYGERTAEDRFRLYQGQERAGNNMVNLLINGTTKNIDRTHAFYSNSLKNKWKPEPFSVGDTKNIPLIVVGNGMFGKSAMPIKGHKTGVVGVLWRALKRREAAGDLLTITIDEYKTSRICNNCQQS
ncbi:hypothetical protein BDF20DRAFT_945378 [Mycotypha africana]|uniref:uncharacterized protein n=1 Tax=Mycotypha africana TaxID=64632 RepID=UPI00230163AA|nr:uncharacterized protein BDF20DRAFT_945378 [Mycotypha africana]KAI8973180.1 hypothetical protein BDF20DRAFT_945378 [Mycotypha africana]